jgi:hypothetical protein
MQRSLNYCALAHADQPTARAALFGPSFSRSAARAQPPRDARSCGLPFRERPTLPRGLRNEVANLAGDRAVLTLRPPAQ